jgi:hypothetical protein
MSAKEVSKATLDRLQNVAGSIGFSKAFSPSPSGTTSHGSRLAWLFHCDSSRYRVEAVVCPSSDGWIQFDTDQDAWYYGVWVNPSLKSIVTYAEGDLHITTSQTNEQWNEEVDSLLEFHQEEPIVASAMSEDGTWTQYQAKWPDLYL